MDIIQQEETIDDNLLDSTSKIKINPPVNGSHRVLNDSSVYTKGLIGMILCIIPGAIIGLVLVKISLDQANTGIKKYNDNPNEYKLSSINMIKKGRKFAYIGLTVFIVEIITLAFIMSIN